jgi:DNA repair photolyase
MGLNKTSGNMYSWITKTWNPIRGACPHQCAYCYVKKSRAKWLYEGPPKLIESQFKKSLGKDNFIFVGSMIDIFAAEIKGAWIGETLEYCRSFPDNKYLFQSKNPIAMLDWIDEFPANSIIGTTIETNRFYSDHMGKTPLPQSRADHMRRISKMYPTMLTIEPIMAFNLDVLVNLVRWCQPQWVNVGADSQGHNLPEPTATEVEALISELKKFTEVKVKKNLRRLL